MNIQVNVPQPPREIHPLIQCIIDNDLKNLKKSLKNCRINQIYPSVDWNDYITPLIAAVVNHRQEIFTFLLQQGAEPDLASQRGLTPLHYVSLSKAPLYFVGKMLEAKADPNIMDLQGFTPLHTAAINDRQDVFEVLISAGALVTLSLNANVSYDDKVSQMVRNLASKGNELCSKVSYFVELSLAVRRKTPEKVLKIFDKGMLREDPQTHVITLETLLNITGPDEVKEKYRRGGINWLKVTGNMDTYIAGAIRRFPNILESWVLQAIYCLNLVLCSVDEIPNEQARALIPLLLQELGPGKRTDVYMGVIQTLYVITQKTGEKKGWDPIFMDNFCETIVPFIQEGNSTDIRVFPYGIFGNLLSYQNACSSTANS